MPEKTYDDGIIEGRIRGVEASMSSHKERLDNHAQRLRLLERIIWGVFGIAVLLQFWPKISAIIGGI